MVLRYIVFALLLILGTDLSGQAPFHRIFEINEQGDTLLHHLASTTTSAGDFISVMGRQINGEYKSLVFTKQDNKGNFDNKVQYIFGEEDEVTDIQDVDLILHEEMSDSLYFSATLIIDDTPQPIVGKLNSGQLGEFKALIVNGLDLGIEPILDEPTGHGQVTSFVDSTFIYTVSDQTVGIVRMKGSGQTRWSQRYELSNADGEMYDAVSYDTDIRAADSTINSIGILHTFDLYHLVVDSLSQGTMAKRYIFPGSIVPVPTATKTIGADDMTMVGYYEDNSNNSISYVIMTDSIGEVSWAKEVTIEGASTEIYKVTQSTTTGQIVIAGKYFPEPDSTMLFTAGIDLDGMVQWISSYGPRPVDVDLKFTSLDPTPEGGVNIADNGYTESNRLGITFIKQGPEGSTACSDTLMPIPFEDLVLTSDTLLIESKVGVGIGVDTVAYLDTTYTNLIEPILNLDPRNKQFCPNEIIDELVTASVSNVDTANVSYLWGPRGETTDTIRVQDTEMYTVTVTVSENSCYTLCDTMMFEQLTAVEVAIDTSFEDYCITGVAILSAIPSNGKGPFAYEWSTGETTQSIEGTPGENYMVRVDDMCGDSAFASILVVVPDNDFDASIIRSQECTDIATLSVNANSPQGGTVFSYQWNDENMSQTGTITVTESGIYTVMVTDGCGEVITVSEEVTIQPLQGLSVNVSGECENGVFQLTASTASASSLNYEWSPGGETTRIINVGNEQATYTVTITDECGDVGMASYELTPSETNYEVSSDCDEVSVADSVRFTINVTTTGDFEVVRLDTVRTDVEPGDGYEIKEIQLFNNEGSINDIRSGKYVITNPSTCENDTLTFTCNKCLEYANVFFPGATANNFQDSLDITFGPVIMEECLDGVAIEDALKEYEFRIFNRWGQEVFMSNDPNAKWDGRWNNELVPSEVYIYYTKYFFDIDGVEGNDSEEPQIDKGDITVVR